MKVIGTLEYIFFYRRKCSVQKKFSQTMLTLMTLLLWISPSLGDDKPPDCKARDPEFCSSPCTYLKDKCNGNKVCNLDVCSYLYPELPLWGLERCWDVPADCTDDIRNPTKRGILNKNVAYLLLKLHPFVNQTSQFGFLTSGRFRRITGNFGTEFLGKRSNNKSNGSERTNKTPPKPQTLPAPKFYSLPLNKFAKTKVLKRNDDVPPEFPISPEKRISLRGNGRVILGSEFLGKRGDQNQRIRRLSGTEFLGKRNDDPFDGSEFLGKRMEEDSVEFLGKRQHEPLSGTELLGKKSSHDSSLELRFKRFGNEFLGKRLNLNEVPGEKSPRDFRFEYDDDPELIDEAFSTYVPVQSARIPAGSRFCRGFGICDKQIK